MSRCRLLTWLLSALILIKIGSVQASTQYEQIYDAAIKTCPIVAKAHEDGLQRRQVESQQLGTLLASVASYEAAVDGDRDAAPLQMRVISALETDLSVFKAMDQVIQTDKANQQGRLFQFTFNKLCLITQHALELAQNKASFEMLREGKLPVGYSLDVPVFNAFPNETHIFSVGKRGNALKRVLMTAWCLQNGKSSLADVGTLFDAGWIDNTPLLHVTPVPDVFDVLGFETSPSFFKDKTTPRAVLTVNNGYAFGGQRLEPRYPGTGASLGPQDCSSFTAKYINCPVAFSTFNLLHLSEDVTGFPEQQVDSALKTKWEESRANMKDDSTQVAIRKILDPRPHPLDPQSKELKVGMVHNERSFNRQAVDGTGGHTGIFIGTTGSAAETKAVTISCARDLENTGKEFIYGVEGRPFFSTADRMIMFFDRKQ